MSRGHGKIQRWVLEYLRDREGWVPVPELLLAWGGEECRVRLRPTALAMGTLTARRPASWAGRPEVWRAVRRLAEEGELEQVYSPLAMDVRPGFGAHPLGRPYVRDVAWVRLSPRSAR